MKLGLLSDPVCATRFNTHLSEITFFIARILLLTIQICFWNIFVINVRYLLHDYHRTILMTTTDGILANAYGNLIEKWLAILMYTVLWFNVFNLLSINLIGLHHSQNKTTAYSKVTISSAV